MRPSSRRSRELLNPGIGQGTAGPGSQTGLKPPADNSFDRRADFAAAHRARKSTAQELREPAQAGYAGKGAPATPIDAELAQALGFEREDRTATAPPTGSELRAFAASPARPPPCRRWSSCCARAVRNSPRSHGRRIVRRDRRNPRAAGGW